MRQGFRDKQVTFALMTLVATDDIPSTYYTKLMGDVTTIVPRFNLFYC